MDIKIDIIKKSYPSLNKNNNKQFHNSSFHISELRSFPSDIYS